MNLKLGVGIMTGLLLATSTSPSAAAVNTKSRTVIVAAPEAAERWNALLAVPRFDPRLGTLRSVTLRLNTQVRGSTRFENLNTSPLTLTQTLCVLFELRRPNFSVLLQGLPLSQVMESVTSFDGRRDFGGASGRTRTNVTATALTELTLNNPNDLLLFTGIGAVGLPLLARPKSGGIGSGDYVQSFSSRSRADLTVVYSYESAPVAVEATSWSAIKSLYR